MAANGGQATFKEHGAEVRGRHELNRAGFLDGGWRKLSHFCTLLLDFDNFDTDPTKSRPNLSFRNDMLTFVDENISRASTKNEGMIQEVNL